MAQSVGAPGESARPNGGCRTARPLTYPAPGCLGAKFFQVRTHYPRSFVHLRAGRGTPRLMGEKKNKKGTELVLDLRGGLDHDIDDWNLARICF